MGIIRANNFACLFQKTATVETMYKQTKAASRLRKITRVYNSNLTSVNKYVYTIHLH